MKYLPSAASHDNIVDKVNELVAEVNILTKGDSNGSDLKLDISGLTEFQQSTMLRLRNIYLNYNKG